jgi:hypothetical protein
MKLSSVLVIGCLSLTSCKTVDAYVVSGETLQTMGETFVALVPIMVQAHEMGAISDAKFDQFKNFAVKFQVAFPAAIRLWQAAVIARDERLQAQAEAIIAALAPELTVFMQLAMESQNAPAHAP